MSASFQTGLVSPRQQISAKVNFNLTIKFSKFTLHTVYFLLSSSWFRIWCTVTLQFLVGDIVTLGWGDKGGGFDWWLDRDMSGKDTDASSFTATLGIRPGLLLNLALYLVHNSWCTLLLVIGTVLSYPSLIYCLCTVCYSEERWSNFVTVILESTNDYESVGRKIDWKTFINDIFFRPITRWRRDKD